MKRNICLVILVFFFMYFHSDVSAETSREYLIKVEDFKKVEELSKFLKIDFIDEIKEIEVIMIRSQSVFSDTVTNKIIMKYGIHYIEPNFKISIPEDQTFFELSNKETMITYSDDPFYDSDPLTQKGQWNLRVLNIEEAWKKETGDNIIIVSVIDTGIAYNHTELNDSYLEGGYNWIENNYDPFDDNGHGSWVSGIISAKRNNQIGISGMGDIRIMAEKVLDSTGSGTISDLIQGIIHAADNGADIINLSLGTDFYSQALKDAVDYAHEKGCILIAAAGNRPNSNPHYPATFSNVIATSATYGEPQDILAPYSNYGEWIDVSAPGGWDNNQNSFPDVGEYWILSASNMVDTYMYGTGTSGAVPHVSGLAALCLSSNPSATNQDIRYFILQSAVDKGSEGWDPFYGHGRINPEEAISLSNIQSVGGDGLMINPKHQIRKNPIIISFIMFVISLSIVMVGIVSKYLLPFMHRDKIKLYKRTRSHIRGK
ncbi:S8 family serine peptidase [Candidatus Bathyarchaeota archaeon]|nr:S8 family serine peptidase [Candidatus Bathyarchaeota archaeon]